MAKLSNQENFYFTDELVVKYSDFADTTTDNATKTFTYAIPAGSIVTCAAAHLRTAFDDSGAGDELTVTVGDGTDPDGFLAAAALHTDQTEISFVGNTGAYLDNENGKVYATADTIDILFTPNISTGTDYALSELTAGEIVFKFGIVAIDPNA